MNATGREGPAVTGAEQSIRPYGAAIVRFGPTADTEACASFQHDLRPLEDRRVVELRRQFAVLDEDPPETVDRIGGCRLIGRKRNETVSVWYVNQLRAWLWFRGQFEAAVTH